MTDRESATTGHERETAKVPDVPEDKEPGGVLNQPDTLEDAPGRASGPDTGKTQHTDDERHVS